MSAKTAHTFVLLLFYLNISAQSTEIEYLRSIHTESEVKRIIDLSYSNKFLNPLPEHQFDSIRSKKIGETFIDPNFGREWTFVYDGGFDIMNSERNPWNYDTSLFFLETGSSITSRYLTLFDGESLAELKSIIVDSLPSFNNRPCRTAFRWLPGNPSKLFYLVDNKIITLDINTGKREVFDEFASFKLSQYDICGGDGSDIAPNGDLLIGNKGDSCFVYNMIEKKVVRSDSNSRIYLNSGHPFPTFDMGTIDYAIAFGGYIFSLDNGISLRDLNGNLIQSLYRRSPHMDPTYYLSDGKLFCGVMVRYNAADSAFYSEKGFISKSGKAYFHTFNTTEPYKLVRFDMDDWPSDTRGSGGQHSCNRYNGSTGLICLHGPALYSLPWQARFGECYEQAYSKGESEFPRRFAYHYIGFDSTYRSSQQPEGWLSPDGRFAVIKTKWGWYKVRLEDRMTKNEIESFITNK